MITNLLRKISHPLYNPGDAANYRPMHAQTVGREISEGLYPTQHADLAARENDVLTQILNALQPGNVQAKYDLPEDQMARQWAAGGSDPSEIVRRALLYPAERVAVGPESYIVRKNPRQQTWVAPSEAGGDMTLSDAAYWQSSMLPMDDADLPTSQDVHNIMKEGMSERMNMPFDALDEYMGRNPDARMRLDLTPGGLHVWDLRSPTRRNSDWRTEYIQQAVVPMHTGSTEAGSGMGMQQVPLPGRLPVEIPPTFLPFGYAGDMGYRAFAHNLGEYPVRITPKLSRSRMDFVSLPLGELGGGEDSPLAQKLLARQDAAVRQMRGPLGKPAIETAQAVGGEMERYLNNPMYRRMLREALMLSLGGAAYNATSEDE